MFVFMITYCIVSVKVSMTYCTIQIFWFIFSTSSYFTRIYAVYYSVIQCCREREDLARLGFMLYFVYYGHKLLLEWQDCQRYTGKWNELGNKHDKDLCCIIKRVILCFFRVKEYLSIYSPKDGFVVAYFDPDPLCPAWHGGRYGDIFHRAVPGIISSYCSPMVPASNRCREVTRNKTKQKTKDYLAGALKKISQD